MAKPDKPRQVALSIEQANAIDLLVVGQTDQEVATAVGVSHQTVCGWRLYHPDFRAELNTRRHEVWGAATDKLRSLLPRALAMLEQEPTTGESRVKVALEVIKLAGIQVGSMGPCDAEEIVAAEAKSRDMALLLNLGGTTDVARVRRELIEKAEQGQRSREGLPLRGQEATHYEKAPQ